ncbi:hypothetical protein, partial [Cryobacterium sp. Y82]|uniref:hypothetical protein n=1 Tax=Cryobacterium sp. Y82 TaxID=2045017 RepID=UPI001E2FCAE4
MNAPTSTSTSVKLPMAVKTQSMIFSQRHTESGSRRGLVLGDGLLVTGKKNASGAPGWFGAGGVGAVGVGGAPGLGGVP